MEIGQNRCFLRKRLVLYMFACVHFFRACFCLFLPVFASFSCLPLRLVMHPFVTFPACLWAFSCLSLCLSCLPAFAPLLVRKCALYCLTLLLSLPAFLIYIACLCVFSCLHFHPFFGNFAMSRGIFWNYN